LSILSILSDSKFLINFRVQEFAGYDCLEGNDIPEIVSDKLVNVDVVNFAV
jgi:hypothetical protein